MQINTFLHHLLTAAEEQGKDAEWGIAYGKDLGITGVEADYDYLRSHFRTVLPLLEKYGIRISSVYGFFNFTQHLAGEEDFAVYSLSCQWGCSNVMPIPGRFSADEEREVQWNRVIDSFRLMCQAGEKTGVATLMEDFDDPLSPCYTLEGLCRLLDAVPAVGCVFDTGNFRPGGTGLEEAYDRLSSRITAVHLKDRLTKAEKRPQFLIADDGTPLYTTPFGTGVIDHRFLLERLRQAGYTGTLSVEHFDLPSQYEGLAQSVNNLKHLLM